MDHPPVDVLRIAGRAATLCGLYAAGVSAFVAGVPALSVTTALIALLGMGLVVAAVLVFTLPHLEGVCGAALASGAVLLTILADGVRFGSLMGWAHGHAALLFAAGVFFLSAWGWSRRAEAVRPTRRPTEDAERVEGG